jgi:hypothetical protein
MFQKDQMHQPRIKAECSKRTRCINKGLKQNVPRGPDASTTDGRAE